MSRQTVTAMVDGKVQTIKVCTSCIKANKVQKVQLDFDRFIKSTAKAVLFLIKIEKYQFYFLYVA